MPRRTTSFRAEWRGIRLALKRHDKGFVSNASTVDSEFDVESVADTVSVVADESADSDA